MELEYGKSHIFYLYTQDDYIYKYMCTVGGGWWMVTEKNIENSPSTCWEYRVFSMT